MVISPSLMYPEGVANTNISLAIAEVPRLMIDSDEGSQQMQDLWENSTLDGEALQKSAKHIHPIACQWFFQGTNITNQPWRAIILGYFMPISRPLYRVTPNNPSTRDLKWAEYRNKIRYNLPTLCLSFTPIKKTLKFAVFSQNCPSLASVGHGPCNWFTWSSWSRKTPGSQKFGLVTTQFSEHICWSTPYQPNTTKKNDFINSRSGLPKTWSVSRYPHFHPDPSGHNVSSIPPFNHIILYKSI